MRRVPVSEQMDWMMNLEDAQEGLLVDGGEAEPIAEIIEEIEEVQEDIDKKPVGDEGDLDKPDDKELESLVTDQEESSVEESSEGNLNEETSSEDGESKEK